MKKEQDYASFMSELLGDDEELSTELEKTMNRVKKTKGDNVKEQAEQKPESTAKKTKSLEPHNKPEAEKDKPEVESPATAEEKALLGNIDLSKLNQTDIIEFFGEEAFEKKGTLKRTFNPNPPKDKIAGKNFNDPSLDIIYGYEYLERRKELEERRKEERKKKLEEIKREEEAQKAKQKKASNKPKKEIKVPDKYPKTYIDPTDMEIDEKTGKPFYYFNFRKTLHNSKFRFLAKVLPMNAIEEVFYDKDFLDTIAERQHEKCERLNMLSASEQYLRDMRVMGAKIGVLCVFMIAVFFKVVYSIIPSNNYDAATELFIARNYEQAYYGFSELGAYENAVYYAKYSEGKMFYKTEQYAEAQEAFELLLPYQEIFDKLNITIQNDVYECRYQIALSHYYNNQYEEAKNIFRDIYTYADATEYYYKCGYAIADKLYEEGNYELALKYFYQVRNSATSDAEERMLKICDVLYADVMKLYDGKQYDSALEKFKYLAIYKYSNAEEMVYQCTYRYGLDLFKNRQYESARKTLSAIPEYKDSYALQKECIYHIADILYDNNPVESIAEYKKIRGYKESDNILYSSRLVMYGKWEITELNGSKIPAVEFSFYDDGKFRTDKQILSVAISTEANPISYTWDGEKFTALDGAYLITPAYDQAKNELTITCTETETSKVNVYKCRNLMNYDKMILSESNSGETDVGEMTLNQEFEKLIQQYIEKKTDRLVQVNGEDKNVFSSVEVE